MLPEVWQATHKVAAQPRLAARKKGLVSEVVLACRGPDLRKRQPPFPAFRPCCKKQQHPVPDCLAVRSTAVGRWVNVGSAPPLLRPVSMDTHTSPHTHQPRRRPPVRTLCSHRTQSHCLLTDLFQGSAWGCWKACCRSSPVLRLIW